MPTNDYSKNIVYLSKEQYQTLITNQSVTANGQTITYNENDIYVTPQAEPITDVKINNVSIGSNGVANIPVASSNQIGCFKVGSGFYVNPNTGVLEAYNNNLSVYKEGLTSSAPVTVQNQHRSTFFGLAKAAGTDLKDVANVVVGTYPDNAKAAIQQMLGVSDLLAPTEPTLVASKAYAVGDVFTANGKLYKVTSAIVSGESIVVQDKGETVSEHKAEEVTVGEYAVHDVQINGTSVTADGVVNIPVAGVGVLGAIKVGSNKAHGLEIKTSAGNVGMIAIAPATSADIKSEGTSYRPIAPDRQHEATFYGLSKVAGVDLANETVTLGTYPETSKTAIRALIGATSSNVIEVSDTQPTDTDNKIWMPETAPTGIEVPTYAEFQALDAATVKDVQINGTSIVSNGMANIPWASSSSYGVVKINSNYGLDLFTAGTGDRLVHVKASTSAKVKGGTEYYQPIVPYFQHESAFYGLAKAAGDTTQSASSNAVGTYTDNAKASIKSMLGIVDGSTGTVTVTGTTPTITAVENTRYVCGEVSTLSITPPASGICIVRFTSGTTAAVVTVPNTVKFPEWFDVTTLDANTIYEMCITDGIYGAVMSWAL